jgi:hypothetical protein
LYSDERQIPNNFAALHAIQVAMAQTCSSHALMSSWLLLWQTAHRCDCSAINRGVKSLHFRKLSTFIKMVDVAGVPAEVMSVIGSPTLSNAGR